MAKVSSSETKVDVSVRLHELLLKRLSFRVLSHDNFESC